ncbi:MAG: cohesin domain-containing protein, partial [Patescibacteria group bacterium]
MRFSLEFKKVFFGAAIVATALFITTPVQAATLSLVPPTGVVVAGESFSVNVVTGSVDQPMNAVSGTITFPTDLIEVVSLSKEGSVITYWVEEPNSSNVSVGGSGTIKFEGVTLNPGFIGSTGRILNLRFRAKQPGTANLEFAGGSVLANDGQGTNILENLSGARLTILPARVETPIRPTPTTLLAAV